MGANAWATREIKPDSTAVGRSEINWNTPNSSGHSSSYSMSYDSRNDKTGQGADMKAEMAANADKWDLAWYDAVTPSWWLRQSGLFAEPEPVKLERPEPRAWWPKLQFRPRMAGETLEEYQASERALNASTTTGGEVAVTQMKSVD